MLFCFFVIVVVVVVGGGGGVNVVYVDVIIFVFLDVDVDVQVDLTLPVMEIEFGWVGGLLCKPIFMSNPTQLSQVETVLRLSRGFDKNNNSTQIVLHSQIANMFRFNINVLNLKEKLALREGNKKKEKKLVEFFTKVGGWGQQWTDFPLIFFFFLKKI